MSPDICVACKNWWQYWIGVGRAGRKQAFADLEKEFWRLRRDFEGVPPLPAELRFAQYPEWLPSNDPSLKQRVKRGEQGYGWGCLDEGGFRRLTWAAEQELKVHGEAKRATRGRSAASVVKPRRLSGPRIREAPFAPGLVTEEPRPTKPAPERFRFDPAALGGLEREHE